jgi:hypothetical protein
MSLKPRPIDGDQAGGDGVVRFRHVVGMSLTHPLTSKMKDERFAGDAR